MQKKEIRVGVLAGQNGFSSLAFASLRFFAQFWQMALLLQLKL